MTESLRGLNSSWWTQSVVRLVAVGLAACLATCSCPLRGPRPKPLSWQLYQCNHMMGCEVVAIFADQRDCIDHERLRWSSCDPEKIQAGKLQCEVMNEKTLNGFEGVTRCTEGYLRWEDVADAGRWDF